MGGIDLSSEKSTEEKTLERLKGIVELQKEIEIEFGDDGYNVFIFGSYVTNRYKEGVSDIDIAIYTEDFKLYKRLSLYMEEYFKQKSIASDIFYIDTSVEAPIYCAPLKSKIQFTNYYPKKLVNFREKCQKKLDDTKARMIG